MSDNAFELSNQCVSYDGKIVLDIDHLEIKRHTNVALIGKSGSGKSTLLRKLRALAPEHCAICPQHLGLVPPLSTLHNIYMGGLHRHPNWFNLLNLIYPTAKVRSEITTLCHSLELEEYTGISVDRLSGGQMQRTAIGRALYQQADIFLGDEPVSAVDSHQASRLLELIQSKHSTVVVALHDQNLALKHFDRVIGLQQGKIVLDMDSDQVCTEQLHTFYQAD